MKGNRSLAKGENEGALKSAKVLTTIILYLWTCAGAPSARAYAFYYTVADMRQPPSQSGNSACPIPAHFRNSGQSISRRWSTFLGSSPTTVLTSDSERDARNNEIEAVIAESFNVWTSVSATSLRSSALSPLLRTEARNACNADGQNSICFAQNDMAFTPGVLAFTRVIVADRIGQTLGSVTSTEIGQILDADVYFNPSDSRVTFATPAALSRQPGAFDLESLLTHELGHFFGFSHSAVWRAMMYPFAPAPGTFLGDRPTPQSRDASLADDDRIGLRVLYPDFTDTANTGRISGRITPANPISLPLAPANVSGLFGAHVVAVDADTGAVVAGVLSGWSCNGGGQRNSTGRFALNTCLYDPEKLILFTLNR